MTLVFLELPHYSISQWNSTKGNTGLDEYKQQDQELLVRINTVNAHIRTLNSVPGISSPKFAADVLNNRKSKGKAHYYSLNRKLLKDGVHPDITISACAVY